MKNFITRIFITSLVASLLLPNLALGASNNKKILLKIPFISQAPFRNWKDIRQQDGCEEASSLMAIKWVRGQTITKDEALATITGASDYLLKKYGEFRDISVKDTVDWIIKDYFNYKKVALKKNVTKNNIISELAQNHAVIAPMNGQALHNPNFTQPGPLHHMLVIRGYDPVKHIFITNDPGTRNGELYQYNEDVLYNAIRDYHTGFQVPDTTVAKDIIIVWK